MTNAKGEIDQEKISRSCSSSGCIKKGGHEVSLFLQVRLRGISLLGLSTRPVTIKGKQAAAAVGQSILIQTYMEQLVDLVSSLHRFY